MCVLPILIHKKGFKSLQHQDEAVQFMIEAENDQDRRAVMLEHDTGSGKTSKLDATPKDINSRSNMPETYNGKSTPENVGPG